MPLLKSAADIQPVVADPLSGYGDRIRTLASIGKDPVAVAIALGRVVSQMASRVSARTSTDLSTHKQAVLRGQRHDHRRVDVGNGIYDDGEWTCGGCISRRAHE